MKVEYAYIMKSMMGGIDYCGDLIYIKEYDNKYFFAAIDVLGHGSEARVLAIEISSYLDSCYMNDLISIMKGLHERILGSRGAVASLCLIDEGGKLQHVGIGNISVRIKSTQSSRLVSRDGIIGYGHLKPSLTEKLLEAGDIVILYSDGIQSRFRWDDCNELLTKTAEDIVYGILERYGKQDDDSSCLAIKIN